MLGQKTADLETGARRWVRRAWGVPSIHTRQKWAAVWPQLAGLPERGLRVLDAGCGKGTWTLELAARRPGWQILGLDFSETFLREAEESRRRLGIENARFELGDFMRFDPAEPFDVVLSVASVHYLASDGRGDEIFGRFRGWLKPGGTLAVLGPRRVEEAPFVSALTHPPWHPVFTRDALSELCQRNRLRVASLAGCVGPLGTLAKQLNWCVERRSSLLRLGLYPAQLLLDLLDRGGRANESRPSLFFLLVARAA
jgi:SAM-dependent methyltransferase